MTDRVFALTVALEEDVRDDDIEATIAAIKQIRGVLSVRSNVADSTLWVAVERARAELRAKLVEVLRG